jgi:hypothetical protein
MTRPANSCGGKFKTINPFPRYPHETAVNGIEAFPVELEVNSGWGDTVLVIIMSFSQILKSIFLSLMNAPQAIIL